MRRLGHRGIEKIVNSIASGHFLEGEALPGEQALAAFLEVSRPTMREIAWAFMITEGRRCRPAPLP